MTTPIDLSRLARPVVPGLLLSVDEVQDELLDWLEREHEWVVTRSADDPAWRLTRLLAGRESVVRRAIADALAQGSLAYAAGQALDHIGATYYSLVRHAGEPDDRYRERLAGAFERYAVGLSGPWYESVARGVAGVADARVTSPNAGEVAIYILADETRTLPSGDAQYPDGIPDQALLDAVTAEVTAEENRQQTDTVTVAACTRALYDVTVTLTLLAEPDSEIVIAEARAALADVARRAARLGAGVMKEVVAGAAVDAAAVSAAVVVLETIGRATLTVGAGDAAFTVTAQEHGAAGDGISIEVAAAAAQLAVAVVGQAITVTPGGATTAAEVVDAIAADAAASALVAASLPSTSDGTGVVMAAVSAPLAGGAPVEVDSIAGMDSVAPQLRSATVGVA